MAKKPKHIRVRVLRSFNGLSKGDEAPAYLDSLMQGWINAGLIEVIEDGEDPAGPGSIEQDDHERVPDGAAGSLSASGEQGQGFGSGAYGTPARLDQS